VRWVDFPTVCACQSIYQRRQPKFLTFDSMAEAESKRLFDVATFTKSSSDKTLA
jgi:hypothetical protein